MAITYNILNYDNLQLIIQKAKLKVDGCYKLRGIMYRVRKGVVTHYAAKGEILECFGHFNFRIGTYTTEAERVKLLKGI